jgi:hypothetical protein
MSQLFIDLSAEEQEVVAGGSAIPDGIVDFEQLESSKFATKYLFANRKSGTGAGPWGANTYSNNTLEKDSLVAKARNKVKTKFAG